MISHEDYCALAAAELICRKLRNEDMQAGAAIALLSIIRDRLYRNDPGYEEVKDEDAGFEHQRLTGQGRLVQPDPVWTWTMLWENCGGLVSAREIAGRLNMDLATFHARRKAAGFPEPRIMGKRGRGKKHLWAKHEVLEYLHSHLLNGNRPPILNGKIQIDAARRRAESGC